MDLPRLLAITPGDGRALTPWLVALGRAGLPAVLLREPTTTKLSELVRVAHDHVPQVWVHGRHPDAPTSGRPVHWPAHGPTPTTHGWGRSCHTVDEAHQAFGAGASWAFLSPIWRPTSKPDDRRAPLGLAVAAGSPHRARVYALGGITPARHREVLARGLAGSAVLGGLFGAVDPPRAAERLRAYLLVDR